MIQINQYDLQENKKELLQKSHVLEKQGIVYDNETTLTAISEASALYDDLNALIERYKVILENHADQMGKMGEEFSLIDVALSNHINGCFSLNTSINTFKK